MEQKNQFHVFFPYCHLVLHPLPGRMPAEQKKDFLTTTMGHRQSWSAPEVTLQLCRSFYKPLSVLWSPHIYHHWRVCFKELVQAILYIRIYLCVCTLTGHILAQESGFPFHPMCLWAWPLVFRLGRNHFHLVRQLISSRTCVLRVGLAVRAACNLSTRENMAV